MQPCFLPFPFRNVWWLCAIWVKPGLLWMAPSVLEHIEFEKIFWNINVTLKNTIFLVSLNIFVILRKKFYSLAYFFNTTVLEGWADTFMWKQKHLVILILHSSGNAVVLIVDTSAEQLYFSFCAWDWESLLNCVSSCLGAGVGEEVFSASQKTIWFYKIFPVNFGA